MLSLVEARTSRGGLLQLSLSNPLNGYVIEDIEGLEPTRAFMVSSSFANQDGEQYHSSRRDARNIKIKLRLVPDYIRKDVEFLRNTLYAFFMPKSPINLRFVRDDGFEVQIDGYVEDFATPLFTKEPEVTISVMCFDPDFVKPNPGTVKSYTTSLDTEEHIVYQGTVDTPIKLELYVDYAVSEFTIYLRNNNEQMRTFEFSYPLLAGDRVIINSYRGEKGVFLRRNNADSSILWAMSPQSSWLEWKPGSNYFRFYVVGEPMYYTAESWQRYGGL